MKSKVYHRTRSGTDQAPRIEMVRIEHGIFDEQDQGLDTSN